MSTTMEEARTVLRELFGHPDFREGQEAVVEAVLGGRDVLSIMPTGAGKSLCYQLPAMVLDGCTLVISPLLALMKDQIDSLPEPVYERTTVLNSLVEREEVSARQAALAEGRYKLVYAAPERLRQQSFIHALRRAKISMVVVDEAHCVSLWGHDFRPDYLFVRRLLELVGEPRVLAMTATATPAIQAELSERFDRELTTLTTGVLRPNLRLEVRSLADKEAKIRALVEICREERGSGIVYVTSREQAEQLAQVLRQHRINASHYHAGMDRGERDAAQNAYMLDRTRVMVATVAFGMGVDKPNVRFVVHFNPPRSLEAYAQESGRAGRDRRPARCVILETRADRANLRRWVHEDVLDVTLLRQIYAALRRRQVDGYVLTTGDRLLNAVGSDGALGDTELRAAISVLERVGLLRRHVDLPRYLSLELHVDRQTREVEPELDRLATAVGLDRGRIVSLETVRTAVEAGIAPERLEGLALDWQDAGLVSTHATGREMLIQLLPATPDAPTRVESMLGAWQSAQEARLETLFAYLDSRACRHRVIAEHFGVETALRCGMCDNCAPILGDSPVASTEAAQTVTDAHPGDIILDCRKNLPFRIGKKKLALILRGSIQSPIGPDRCARFGALAHVSVGKIESEIERLVEAGYLARDEGEYPTLYVTERGLEKEPDPPPPPPPPPAQRKPVAVATPERRPDAAPTLLGPDAEDDRDEAADEALFERLRSWRRLRAEAERVPPYVVFHDTTLRSIARARPADEVALGQVQGIGPAKIERYGLAVLALLAEEQERGQPGGPA